VFFDLVLKKAQKKHLRFNENKLIIAEKNNQKHTTGFEFILNLFKNKEKLKIIPSFNPLKLYYLKQ
jgi:hypothetical protein